MYAEYSENLTLDSTLSDLSLAHLIKKHKREVNTELIAAAWHPRRAFLWCFPYCYSGFILKKEGRCCIANVAHISQPGVNRYIRGRTPFGKQRQQETARVKTCKL